MILTVLGVKGGVGKSTVSMGVAIWMSKEKRVLLLDGDPRVRSVELKLRPKGRGSLFDILSGGLEWKDAVHPCTKVGLQNLSVIPAGRIFLPPGKEWVERLRLAARSLDKMLEQARKEFDHLVIDTPPSIGYEHLLLTAMGEKILYVCEPNDDSILSTKTAAQDFARVCELEPAGVVLSKVVETSDLKTWLGKAGEIGPVLGWIPFDEAAERAFRRNLPVVLDAPESPCSKSLKRVAERLLRMKGKPASVEQRLNMMLEKLGT